jgi:hypothetical protein
MQVVRNAIVICGSREKIAYFAQLQRWMAMQLAKSNPGEDLFYIIHSSAESGFNRHSGSLYKINPVFLRGDGGHRFEVTMEMALVKKTAFQRCFGNIGTPAQEFFGLLNPAVHAIGVRGYTGFGLKVPEQGVGVYAKCIRE